MMMMIGLVKVEWMVCVRNADVGIWCDDASGGLFE